MTNEGNGSTSGAGEAQRLAERMKSLGMEELRYAIRNEDNGYMIAAYLELIRRTAASGPRAAPALIRYAHGPELPYQVRTAAGLKAVELTDEVKTLAEWAQNAYLPSAVMDAAGLKAVEKAATREEIAAIWKMNSSILSEKVLDARCMKLKGTVDPSAGGVLSEGLPRPPAKEAARAQGRSRVFA
jgi:hypothetical protein